VTDENNEPVSLTYKRSFNGKNLNELAYDGLNSIVAIDENKFYVTQMEHAHPPYGPKQISIPVIVLFRETVFPKKRVHFCESKDH